MISISVDDEVGVAFNTDSTWEQSTPKHELATKVVTGTIGKRNRSPTRRIFIVGLETMQRLSVHDRVPISAGDPMEPGHIGMMGKMGRDRSIFLFCELSEIGPLRVREDTRCA